jgi:hypothetical protein
LDRILTGTKMNDNFLDTLESLSREERNALQSLITDNRQALRECLVAEGYLQPVKATQEANTEPIADLTDAQNRLYDIVSKMTQPRTAEEVSSFVQSEDPAFEEQYNSIRHRPWVSSQLNTLVDSGLLGRYRKGRSIKYTSTVEEAVRRWALGESRFVEELDLSEVRSIADETGMPTSAVRRALGGLLD